MSNNQNKSYVALPGGLTCKPCNPFDGNYSPDQYDDFECNNPILPITEVMLEGETFDGSEVWQNRGKSILEWTTNNQKLTEDDIAHLASNFIETRIAIKPLKAKEPEQVYDAEKSDTIHDRVDVVENKETVDDFAERRSNEWTGNVKNAVKQSIIEGARWQQSQSIEGIVGFVLEWFNNSNEGSAAHRSVRQLEQMKSDIIKEYNNGK